MRHLELMSLVGVGTVFGLLAGLLHARYVYRTVAYDIPLDRAPNRARGLYYAMWTVGLWLLLGGYVLVLGLIAALLYTCRGLLRRWT